MDHFIGFFVGKPLFDKTIKIIYFVKFGWIFCQGQSFCLRPYWSFFNKKANISQSLSERELIIFILNKQSLCGWLKYRGSSLSLLVLMLEHFKIIFISHSQSASNLKFMFCWFNSVARLEFELDVKDNAAHAPCTSIGWKQTLWQLPAVVIKGV